MKNKQSFSANKKLKTIPRFKNEDEERDFWATHDTTDYFDTNDLVEFDLSELQPSTRSITVRLSESLLAGLKQLAHKRDIPYQSLLKNFLAERVERELRLCP